MVGERLREHGTYRKLLDEEGKRCWTLEYAEEDGVGFHLDVLPSVPDHRSVLDTSIAITNKQNVVYHWSASNPSGYGLWFDSKNQTAFERALFEQKASIQARASNIYARVDDVPDQLVRTPLQRSIQLMKRHRDMRFNNVRYNGFAPISIIITTLAAQFYQDEQDIYSALTGIVSKLHAHAVLVDDGTVDKFLSPFSPIKRTPDGRWYIGNPVNPEKTSQTAGTKTITHAQGPSSHGSPRYEKTSSTSRPIRVRVHLPSASPKRLALRLYRAISI